MVKKKKGKCNINFIYVVIALIGLFGTFVYTYDKMVESNMYSGSAAYFVVKENKGFDELLESEGYKEFVDHVLKKDDISYEECTKNESCKDSIKSDSFITYFYIHQNYRNDFKSFMIYFAIIMLIIIGLLTILIYKKNLSGIILSIIGLILVYFDVFEFSQTLFTVNKCVKFTLMIPFIVMLIEFVVNHFVNCKKA